MRTRHGWTRVPAKTAKAFVREHLDGEPRYAVIAWLVGPVAHRPKRKPERYFYFRREPVDRRGWDEWDYNLWHGVRDWWSRRNIRRWLAGQLLPANLSAAGLEELFRKQCSGQYYQPHHFREITMI